MAVAQIELRGLETRVTWLERTVQELRGERQHAPARKKKGISEQDQLLTELEAEGLIRGLTPAERAYAEQWRALPEEEKRAVTQELQNLKPGPMLSDIILQNRR